MDPSRDRVDSGCENDVNWGQTPSFTAVITDSHVLASLLRSVCKIIRRGEKFSEKHDQNTFLFFIERAWSA